MKNATEGRTGFFYHTGFGVEGVELLQSEKQGGKQS